MKLTELIDELSIERIFKNANGNEISSFLKALSDRQLEHFANNLNESVYNAEQREHQAMIACAYLAAAPVIVGARKEGYKAELMSCHCDFDKRKKEYLKHFKDEISLGDEERIEVLLNLAKLTKMKLSSEQRDHIRDTIQHGEGLISDVYKFIICPIFGYL